MENNLSSVNFATTFLTGSVRRTECKSHSPVLEKGKTDQYLIPVPHTHTHTHIERDTRTYPHTQTQAERERESNYGII